MHSSRLLFAAFHANVALLKELVHNFFLLLKFNGILIKQCSINNIVVHMFQNQQVVQVSAIQGLKLRYRYLHPFKLTVSVDPDVPKQMTSVNLHG